jgi:hypothetical protein
MIAMKPWLPFFAGMMVMADLVAMVFFLRFWKSSGDRLFAYFAAAFFVLALQRTGLTLSTMDDTLELISYALRAVAFTLIIIGIVDKNRSTA